MGLNHLASIPFLVVWVCHIPVIMQSRLLSPILSSGPSIYGTHVRSLLLELELARELVILIIDSDPNAELYYQINTRT